MAVSDLSFLDDIGKKKLPNRGSELAMVFEKWGKLFVQKTQANLAARVKDAETGNLYQSIAFDVDIEGDSYTFKIIMADYWEYVDQGRKPGKKPPIKPIVEWIQNKPTLKAKLGLTNKKLKSQGTARLGDITARKPILAAAFGISVNIGKKGTKATKFFSDVVNDVSIELLERDLIRALGKEVEIGVRKIFVEAIK